MNKKAVLLIFAAICLVAGCNFKHSAEDDFQPLNASQPDKSLQWFKDIQIHYSFACDWDYLLKNNPDFIEWDNGIYMNVHDYLTDRGVRISGGVAENEYPEYPQRAWYFHDLQDDNGVVTRV